ncbi:DUF2520 domain-containing protein [Conexibacter sp. SYSU D00693]|uniref:DUF2520 domain-containing protein n=1 Tax=Conexibacter sp. SYSU D00693 TaxID=2812560 RepID=UPI001F11EE9B|nr:DUF2520 domain-containing protein [Conexibacter sp. SYSU D00693]
MTTFSHRMAVIGRGRLGGALCRALRDAGLPVDGPLGRGADAAGADVVLLAVPDGAIADAAACVAPREGLLVGHCSGATTLEPLAGHEAFSLHPLMTVTGPESVLAGAGCAVAGATDRARRTALALGQALSMRPVTVADGDRAAYHAAASIASNFLVALEDLAERLATTTGTSREVLVPLVRATVDGWAAKGADALTGPIARGDAATVARQRAAVAERLPAEDLELFDALVTATQRVADRGAVAA